MIFEKVEIANPALQKIAERYNEGGAEFYSLFFHQVTPFPPFNGDHFVFLSEIFQSAFLRESVPELFPIFEDKAKKFTVFDRYEFEGSLISMFIKWHLH